MLPPIIDRIAIYCLMAGCFCGIGFIAGWRVEKWHYNSQELATTQIALKVLRDNVDKSIKNTQNLIDLQQQIVLDKNQKIVDMQKRLGDINDFVKKLLPINIVLDDQHQQLLKHVSEEANRLISEGK